MRVLVAHDGSAAAHVASELASTLAWPPGSTIRLLGVAEADLPSLPDGAGEQRRTEDTPESLEATLERDARQLAQRGIAVERRIVRGRVASAVVDEADTWNADLLITGSRGLGFVGSVLAGSVTGEIVDRAPCPVLVARAARVRHVLLAVDGSQPSGAAVDLVSRWPIFEGARIRVLSVTTDAPQYTGLSGSGGVDDALVANRARRIADESAMRLLDAGMSAVTEVAVGEATSQIVKVAEARSVDLIVIGSRGLTGLRRTFLGSVARGVLYAASTSVLIVRMPAAGDDDD